MSAAAAETDTEAPVEELAAKGPDRPAPPTKAVFQSQREDLVLVVEKDPFTMGPNGEKVFGTGKHVQFVDGHLYVPLDGEDVIGTRGERIDAQELLVYLEGGKNADGKKVSPHPMFGNHDEGFWRHYEAPPAVSEAESDELLVMAEERDLDGIERFIEAERDGWNRSELLKVAEGSRDRVAARLASS
jgi:hypothetical protein